MNSYGGLTLPKLGYEELDREHEEIIKQIARVRGAMRLDLNDASRRSLCGILEDCISYMQKHFQTEEGMMLQSGYPSFAAHKQEHEVFLARFSDLLRLTKTGSPSQAIETLNLLGNLLHHHVLGTDKPLVPHLLKSAVCDPDPRVG